MRYIEQFETGIQKILAVYEATSAKPQFQFSENLIRVTLPVIKATLQPTVKGLTADEEHLLEQMQSYRSYTRNQRRALIRIKPSGCYAISKLRD